MKKHLLILLCCLFYNLNLYSQEYCEVDKVFTSFDRQEGRNIIQTTDRNFITLSISGLNGQMNVVTPKFVLMKTDKCGNIFWWFPYDYCYYCSAGTSILMEDNDGSIIFGGYLHSNYPDTIRKDLRLYKTSSSGQLIWSIQFGDTTKKYVQITGKKINNNRFLFVGSYIALDPSKMNPTILIIDSLGNTLFQEDFPTQNGYFFSAHLVNRNNILLIGKLEQNIFTINIDSNGNRIVSNTIQRYRNMEPYNLTPNSELTRFLYVASNSSNQVLLAQLDINGNLIKDSLFSPGVISTINGKMVRNNSMIFSSVRITLLDSNFHLKWVDENIVSPRLAYSTLITEDETVVSTGHGNGRLIGTGNYIYDYWFGSKSISTIAKAISMNGRDLIDKKHDTLQLSVSVLPITTINKTVLWVINDTNLATITQTGLLTAKANGVVTITATTTDGSNLSAQKVITISNQTVGLEANSKLLQNLRIYPNPAKDYVVVDDAGAGMETMEILNINGSVVYTIDVSNCTNPCSYPTKDLSNGIYFVRMHSRFGSVVKKIAVFR